MAATRRKPKRFIQPRNNQAFAISAEVLAELHCATAPDPAVTQAQLITMRKVLGLARGQIAAIVGTSYGSLRCWDEGRRKANIGMRFRINEVFQSLQVAMQRRSKADAEAKAGRQKRQKSTTPTLEGQCSPPANTDVTTK